MSVSHDVVRFPCEFRREHTVLDGPHATPAESVLAGILIGRSLAIRRVRRRIMQLAPTMLPVLIEGPTGCGKELVARSLHDLSGRPGRLVSLNVGAIADSMFEDALFGHLRGAFTGASAEMPGFLLEADRGTVFLDEISTLPLSLQAKLLRALETREFRPIGARVDQRSDFRLIAASNDDLCTLALTGRFRQDLLYRIRAGVIRVPSLRERIEDVALLAEYFARATGPNEDPADGAITLSPAAIRRLEAWPWAGNVRELRHVIELARVLADCRQVIDAADVHEALCDLGGARGEPTSNGLTGEAERQRLVDALERCGGEAQKAAQSIGISRSHMYRRMRELGIAPRGRQSLT